MPVNGSTEVIDELARGHAAILTEVGREERSVELEDPHPAEQPGRDEQNLARLATSLSADPCSADFGHDRCGTLVDPVLVAENRP